MILKISDVKDALKKDEARLQTLKAGSKEWCELFAVIEYVKEQIEGGTL